MTKTMWLYRVSVPLAGGKHDVLILREDKLDEHRGKPGVQITPLCEWTPMVTPGDAT